jgi:ABC-type Na+ efflux pump permease subunit
MITRLCPPAVIYVVFFLVHSTVSTFQDEYEKAIVQIVMGILVTLLLQFLCIKGMNLISWIIVFIPFIFYTYMVIIIYHVFGLNPGSDETSKSGVDISVNDDN